jgi:hypothetical protein
MSGAMVMSSLGFCGTGDAELKEFAMEALNYRGGEIRDHSS